MDNIKLDFEQAKAKHLLFKSKLRSILYGASMDEAPVLSEYECGVGKWIYNHALSVYGEIPDMQTLEKVHAEIHAVARELIKLYKEGKVDEARLGLTKVENVADHLVSLLGTVEEKIKKADLERIPEYQGLEQSVEELNDLLKANEQLDKTIRQQSGELIKERNLLHDFFMQTPAALTILKGPDHVYELANPLYRQLIGNRNPIGKSVREALPELEGQGFYELLDNVYKTKQTFIGTELPISLNRGKGSLEQFYLNFSYQAFENAEGQTEGILVFAYDVTEAVVARKKIEESTERIRFIFEAIPEKIWAANAEGSVQYLNKQWTDYTGLSQEELKDWGWTNSIHPTDIKETLKQWEYSIANGTSLESEHRIRSSDGEYRWHLKRSVPQKGSDGKILMWIETNTDIHDLVTVRNQLKSSYEDLEVKVKFRNIELERENLELQKKLSLLENK